MPAGGGRSSSGATPPVGSSTPSAVVGGFDARAERSRKSTQRFVRTFVRLLLIVIVGVAGASGVYLYLGYVSQKDARRFAEASTYYEHHLRLRGGDAVRACALVEAEPPSFSCRYSKEWFATWLPDLEPALVERAPGACFGTLREDGQNLYEILDCTLSVQRDGATEKERLYFSRARECATRLADIEVGGSTECRVGKVARVLLPRAEAPSPDLGTTLTFEYRRNVDLPTDVGTLATREFIVRGGSTAEYRYYAPSIGLFVRRAELAGSASLRISYSERGGQTAGTQVWPR